MTEEMIYAGKMPVLALRGLAIFPEQTVHFDVGRVKSVLALEEAMKGDQMLFLVPQKDIMDEDPDLSKLFTIGTVVKVKQILKAQNDLTAEYGTEILSLDYRNEKLTIRMTAVPKTYTEGMRAEFVVDTGSGPPGI